MPEISRFYGIIIQMFFKDHNPPHFHIEYGEYKAVINIDNEIVKGYMSKRALILVFEWMDIHERSSWKIGNYAKKANYLIKYNL